MRKENYHIEGMSCAACVAHVEKAVRSIKAVEEVQVSLLTNSMEVKMSDKVTDEEIEKAVSDAGYKASAFDRRSPLEDKKQLYEDKETGRIVKRLILSIIFLIPLIYFSMAYMFGGPVGLFAEDILSLGILLMLLTAVIMMINNNFFVSGTKALYHRAPNMDTLVALGSSVAFIYSVILLFQMSNAITHGEIDHAKHLSMSLAFETAGMVPVLITIGKALESYAKGKTTSSIKRLIDLAPRQATVIRDGEEEILPAKDLKKGDILLVRPGESFAADGVVIEGSSSSDESSLSGESIPVDKEIGSEVFCATINLQGVLKVEVTKIGEDMSLSKIIKTVQEASLGKTKSVALADKVSGVFVPTILAISIIVFACWMIFGKNFVEGLHDENLTLVSYAIERAISVLVIACPCALGLATPVAIVVGNGKGAKNGILFKTSSALEESNRATFVVFDKTGTLTTGKMSVTDVLSFKDVDVLALSASLEHLSEHPIGKAIERRASNENKALSEVADFENKAGYGAQGKISEKSIAVGNSSFMRSLKYSIEAFESEAEELSSSGKTIVYVAYNHEIVGLIAIRDELKEDSKEAITLFKKAGYIPVLLSGDNSQTVKAIAAEAGIEYAFGQHDPIRKRELIATLQKKGRVIMVGDGINDSPSLTQADIGMAIKKGSDIAIDSADVVLMNSSLMDAYKAIHLSKITRRIIAENLFWAFFYNFIMIPIAAGILSFTGIYKLKPWYGSALMALSSVTVVLNALRINLYKLEKPHLRKKKHVDLSLLEEKIKNEERKKVTLSIEGMMCEHCVRAVKTAIERIEGTSEAEVSLENNQASFLLGEASLDEVKLAIEEEGYTVKTE